MTLRSALSALLIASSGIAHAETVTGIVIRVADGDTLTVLDAQHHQHRVRLAGIDAPEKGQDFGDVSRRSLHDLAHGQQAVVETRKMDRYGRAVGKVIVQGEDVGIEQLRRGLAWHYKAYEREQSLEDRSAYSKVESAAKEHQTGLWAMPSPQPPWKYRRRHAGSARLQILLLP